MKNLKTLLQFIGSSGRKRLYALVVLMSAAAIVEVAGIGSIIPFLTLLSSPEMLEKSQTLLAVKSYFSINTNTGILILLGIFSFVLFVFGNIMSLLVAAMTQHFVWRESEKISSRLFEGFLAEPYQQFVVKPSSERMNMLFTQVNLAVGNYFLPALNIISRGLSAFLSLSFLLWLNPKIALFSTALFLFGYGVIFILLKKRIAYWGNAYIERNNDAYRIAGDSLHGFKNLRLYGAEKDASQEFSHTINWIGGLVARSQLAAMLPKYMIETVAFGSMFIVLIYALRYGAKIDDILPVVGAYAFAGVRMLPSVNAVYQSISYMQNSKSAFSSVINTLENSQRLEEKEVAVWTGPGELVLDKVSFSHLNQENQLFSDYNFHLKKGEVVAIQGRTGSGKSTLIDLIAGLLTPQAGNVLVDGIVLNAENSRSWQRSISYVTQENWFADKTFAQSIADGDRFIPFDQERVENAARLACIEPEILSQSEGYHTSIGERGGKLSGGQRQRLALARAIYRAPKLLILDEATSALDETTEYQILETLKTLQKSMSIILITHRPALLNIATRIVNID